MVEQNLKSGRKTAFSLQRILRSIRKGSAVREQIKAMWGTSAKEWGAIASGVESQRWGVNAKTAPKTQRRWGQNANETSHTAL